jgi:ribosomal protein L37AE/L43A
MKGTCTARDLHSAIDEAWERARQEVTCPECDSSTSLSEGHTICWGCQASDYQEGGDIDTQRERP